MKCIIIKKLESENLHLQKKNNKDVQYRKDENKNRIFRPVESFTPYNKTMNLMITN